MHVPEKWEKILSPLGDVSLSALSAPSQPGETAILRAFHLVGGPDDVRVVVIGQDPYHRGGLATGLAFGVTKGEKKLPPSLKNIMCKYYVTDESLHEWARRGVLLLNASLTVEIGKPGSHAAAWRSAVCQVLHNLAETAADRKKCLHFVLWGKHACDMYSQSVGRIPNSPHTSCASSHPSPLACRRPLKCFPPFLETCPLTGCGCALLYPAARISEVTDDLPQMPL